MSKIVFMGTPDFAVPALKTLLKTQEVVGVVTQPDKPAGRGKQLRPSPVKIVAQEAGIPVYQPKSLRHEDAVVPLRAWQPDMIVVAAFGQILRPLVLNLPPHGCLNVHASLLPRWRGASPIQHAILAGDAETGVTLMQMDVGLDTGAMYVQEGFPIAPQETAATLHDKLADLGANMLEKHLDAIIAGEIQSISQDDALSTYAPMISKDDGRLDWQKSAVELERQIRAMSPWPGAFTFWQDKQLKIIAAEPTALFTYADLPAGTAVKSGDDVVVKTMDGGLLLHKIQLAGKRAMAVADFVRGRPDFFDAMLT